MPFPAMAGFRFLGCLALGMGGAVDCRKPLGPRGLLRRQAKALEQAAGALAGGDKILDATIALMGRPLMPRWFYSLAANWGWKRTARKFKVSKFLRAKPYEPEHLT